MTAAYDAIVLGLGAMGSATAYHLAARGARVLGIDQYAPPHEFGSSHGESRIIRQLYYEHPLYVPLVQRSYELWRRLEQDSNEMLLRINGGLMLGQENSGLISGVRRSAKEYDLPMEEIPAARLQKRFPQFIPLPGFRAILDPAAGYLAPERCVSAHLKLANARGATIRINERVESWEPAGSGVRVKTTKGTYEAGNLVICAGPWVNGVLRDYAFPTSVERQTVLWFDPPGDQAMWMPERFPVYMCEFDDGQLIYGFPLLDRGFKAAVHYEGEPVTDMETIRRTVEQRDITRVQKAVSRLFGWATDAKVVETASCLYTDTLDLRFTIDFLPGLPQVLVSSPCSGHGFKFAAAIGELQAQLVLDRKASFDVSPFRITR